MPDAVGPAGSPYAARPWVDSYPPGVPAEVHVPTVPVTRLLDDATASFPTRTALAFLGTRMTYREVRDVADHLAAALAGLGVGKGDRVAVVLPTCPQHVLTVFAVLRLGAVVVLADPSSSPDDLRARFADSGARLVVCSDQAYAAVAGARSGTAVGHVVVTALADYLPTLRRLRLRLRLPTAGARRDRTQLVTPLPRGADVLSFVRLLRTRRAARQAPVDPETDLALLQYAQVPDGLRAVGVTHENLVSTAYLDRAWDVGGRPGEDVVLGVLPLSHVHGIAEGLLGAVLLAATLVLVPSSRPSEVREAVARWQPTVLPSPSPVLGALVDAVETADDGTHELRCLRLCSVDGSLAADVQARLERLTAAAVLAGHGLGRALPSTHRNPQSELRRTGSIGLPLPGTDCRVVDPRDVRRDVPVGDSGELLVRGPQVFGAAADDGYLHTGTMVCMDEAGFFVLVGPHAGDDGRAGPPCGVRT